MQRNEIRENCREMLLKAYREGEGLEEMIGWLRVKARRLRVTPEATMARAAALLFPEHEGDEAARACAHMDETVGYLEAITEILEQRRDRQTAGQVR